MQKIGSFRKLIENIAVEQGEFDAEFMSWFGNSVVVDDKGKPLMVYHGTGNLNSIDEFKNEFTGRGNDQIGSGFYFTNRHDTAYGYTTRMQPDTEEKFGGSENPGILSVYLKIENPIYLKGESLNQVEFDINQDEALRIIHYSKILRDIDNTPVGSWYDIWSEGLQDWMIDKVAEHYVGPTLIHLENDFFSYDGGSGDFREAVNRVLGFDGVIKDYEKETHFVAWFPSQIKIVARTPKSEA